MSEEKIPAETPLPSSLKVAICQLQSIDSLQTNLQSICELIEAQQNKEPADLYCLPENALYFKLSKNDDFAGLSAEDQFFELQSLCDQHDIHILVGGSPESSTSQVASPVKEESSVRGATENKLKNTTFWLKPHNPVQAVYSKIHMFDVDVEGVRPERESDRFYSGASPVVIDVKGWQVGLSICYDMRFSNLYLAYAEAEVDLLVVPAAFLVPTGRAHWHVLLRARAIESQCYVVAAAQQGVHKSCLFSEAQRETYGHSLVVDPWGAPLLDLEDCAPACEVVELKKTLVAKVRQQIQMKHHRVKLQNLKTLA